MYSYEQVIADQRRPGRTSADGSLDLLDLVRLATLAASSHNTQPWKFRASDRSVEILPDPSRRCPVVDPDDAHLFKSLGCAAENLVHAAAAQGHVAHVALEGGGASIRIKLEPSAAVRADDLFDAIPRRQCVKLAYDGRAVGPDARRALAAAGAVGSVHVRLIDDLKMREAIAEYVREGDHVQLRDRAFRKELVSWLRFNDASAISTGDGLSGRTAGQPSLPEGLAKLIMPFVLTAKAQAETDVANIRKLAARGGVHRLRG